MEAMEAAQKRYHTLEELPQWARPTVEKLAGKGYLAGDDRGSLNLSEDMVRMMVINDRAGVYR